VEETRTTMGKVLARIKVRDSQAFLDAVSSDPVMRSKATQIARLMSDDDYVARLTHEISASSLSTTSIWGST
jgi:hypothetical protein